MPKIAVKVASLSAASQRSYGIPDYWEDQDLRCRNCGAAFPFTAAQQQDWYERQHKHLCVQPVLCPACFYRHSEGRRLKGRMDHALRKLKDSPTVPAKLEAAETIIEYFRHEKRGDVQLALRLSRGVLRVCPDHGVALTLFHAAKAIQSA